MVLICQRIQKCNHVLFHFWGRGQENQVENTALRLRIIRLAGCLDFQQIVVNVGGEDVAQHGGSGASDSPAQRLQCGTKLSFSWRWILLFEESF